MKTDTIITGDCRAVLPTLPANSVDLIITSPPYYTIKDYGADAGQVGNILDFSAYVDALLQVWQASERVLRPNGKLVINTPLMPMPKKEINSHHTRHVFDIHASIQHSILAGTGLYLMDVYVWDRANSHRKLMFGSYPYPGNMYSQNTIEFLAVYVKAGKPAKRDRPTKEQSRLSKAAWLSYTAQVWTLPVPAGGKTYGKHPAPMPEELATRCIRLYTFEGDVILDPFCGAGTTCHAAHKLNRRYIGVEISAKYAELARRVSCVNQTRLDMTI